MVKLPQDLSRRIDMLIAMVLAALIAVWLVIYAVLLIKYGRHGG